MELDYSVVSDAAFEVTTKYEAPCPTHAVQTSYSASVEERMRMREEWSKKNGEATRNAILAANLVLRRDSWKRGLVMAGILLLGILLGRMT